MILSFTRIFNLLKIILSYLISRISGRVIHWGNPVAVSIEPADFCNLSCPECPAGMKKLTRHEGLMQPETFQSIISQMLPHLSYLTLYFQGEPYLNKHFLNFIAFARSKKIFVATATNGHFLDEATVRQTITSGLNQLIISLDGADQESYQAYRMGGDFAKVVAGIRLLVNEKKRMKSDKPEIILQSLLLKSNEHSLAEIKKLGKDLGVDKIIFKTAQFNDYAQGNPLMPENPKFTRYKRISAKTEETQKLKIKSQKSKVKSQNCKSNLKTEKASHLSIVKFSNSQIKSSQADQFSKSAATYIIKNRQPNSCFRMWSSCVITWDGNVVPCCFDKDAKYAAGNMNKQNFNQIWRGHFFQDFRRNILHDRKSIDICTNCSQNF
jgi:radical SAM protein with 4Fe4S-binding SPASM domain